jgi:hypothetical protein
MSEHTKLCCSCSEKTKAWHGLTDSVSFLTLLPLLHPFRLTAHSSFCFIVSTTSTFCFEESLATSFLYCYAFTRFTFRVSLDEQHLVPIDILLHTSCGVFCCDQRFLFRFDLLLCIRPPQLPSCSANLLLSLSSLSSGLFAPPDISNHSRFDPVNY